MENNRFWQNWDQGKAAENIDKYWIAKEKNWRINLVNDIAEKFPRKSKILEIGCGSGLIFDEMSSRKIVTPETYIGGDISKNMLAIAKGRFPKVDFRELDIFSINLNNDFIENVINIHVIQHLPAYEEAVLELIRIAKKNLYIVSWFVMDSEDLIEFSNPSINWDNQQFQNNNYSLPKFIQFLYQKSPKQIKDICIHNFDSKNFSILLKF